MLKEHEEYGSCAVHVAPCGATHELVAGAFLSRSHLAVETSHNEKWRNATSVESSSTVYKRKQAVQGNHGNGTVVLLSRVIFRSSLTPATPHVPISEGTRTRVVRCDLTVHNVSVFCYVRVLFVFFCVFSCVFVSALFFFVLFRFCGSFLVA